MKKVKQDEKREEKQKYEENTLKNLQNRISQCRLCFDLFGFESRPIIQGSREAKIMQISQAPSKKVYETGRPFNDVSGKKLIKDWYEIKEEDFYNPNNFYITSMAHCYPGKAPGRGDRKPPKICSRTWLEQEIALVDHEMYIIIGGFAAGFFFPGEKITSLVFEDKQIHGKPAFILPHPSPLNMKWLKDHPQFEAKRMVEIRKKVHKVLDL